MSVALLEHLEASVTATDEAGSNPNFDHFLNEASEKTQYLLY